jgi:hypothetical protein
MFEKVKESKNSLAGWGGVLVGDYFKRHKSNFSRWKISTR